MRRLALLLVLVGCAPSEPPAEGYMDHDANSNVFTVKTKGGLVIKTKGEEGYLFVGENGKAEWFGPGAPTGKEPKK